MIFCLSDPTANNDLVPNISSTCTHYCYQGIWQPTTAVNKITYILVFEPKYILLNSEGFCG
jgi:hypothetical protein